MEYPHTGQRGLDLDEFASVALQHAATSIRTPQNNIPLTPERSYSLREIQQFNHTFDETGDSNPLAGIPVSPSVLGLSTVSWFDEYTSDPRFVESQRELRELLFTSAQSVAPTRAGTPEGHDPTSSNDSIHIPNAGSLKSVVSTGSRVLWLKNYLDEVAPWVGDYQ